jgi:DNA helicase-2/ATP-dependent DNA helicase PcrA
VLAHYQNLYKYILVDEYQDTNKVQFKLIDLLAARHNNLCVVGDDDQSIYKFRGATIENILSFEKTFDCDPETDVIRLEQNYRSTQNILTAANVLISNNRGRKGKTLWTNFGDGDKVTVFNAPNERTEAKYIAQKIEENVKNGEEYRSHAILYRMNAQSSIIEQTFIRENIPYMVFGGQKFYDRKEIKDMTSYLAVINNPTDILRLRRIINEPKRGIGEATVTAIEQIASDLGISPLEVMRDSQSLAPIAKKSKPLTSIYKMFDELRELAEELPPSELLDEILDRTGYADMLKANGEEGHDRLANIAELKSTMLNYEDSVDDPTIEGFLEEISLYTDIDKLDPLEDYVVMMTIHSAKGLEFDNVFVAGMEENVFPSARSNDTPEDMEEERRLAYVAVTRAKRRLYLLHSTARMLYGRTSVNRPSRFLNELPDDNVVREKEQSAVNPNPNRRPKKPDYSNETSDMLARRSRSAISSETNAAEYYSVGDRISHPKLGEGTVLSITALGGGTSMTMLEIAFENCGTKKIIPPKGMKKI